MKLTRAQFLKALPAAVLALASCTAAPTAPADTDELVFDHAYPLDYATQFTADCYADGSTLLTIPDAQAKFLVRPEGAATLRTVPEGVTVLQQPLQNLYLVSTSVMDLFLALDSLDCIALSGTRAEGWYLDEARQAMLDGRIAYAGKYSAPDYEQILAANCGLAIENTMINHTPDVKEKLQKLGLVVLTEQSSSEPEALGRVEWIKLFGVLFDKEDEAAHLFNEQKARVEQTSGLASSGKTVAYFYINSNGAAVTRRAGDYVAQMIELAGGKYVPEDTGESDNALSTMNMQMEEFYAAAKESDYLIYNSTIDGEIHSISELLAKAPVLKDFKAVQAGNVWCTTKNLYQESMSVGAMLEDIHAIFSGSQEDGTYLYKLQS